MRVPVWKILAFLGLALLLTGVTALAAGGWYFTDRLREDALLLIRREGRLDLEVAAVSKSQITLRRTPQTDENGPWRRDGLWGLEWPGGYDQVGAILEADDQYVAREFLSLVDSPVVGDMVRLDSAAFLRDPQAAFGLDYQQVTFSSPLGEFPAWFVPGQERTWAIFVHGRGANRREALRMLRTVVALGFPSLVITYRNDVEAPASPDGFYRFGATEWKEAEGAVRYAVEHGAEDVVLVGYSMGGGIVASFLYRSPLADAVTGVILDSPMLDFEAAVDLGVWRRGYPPLLVEIAKAMASIRFGLDWQELDYLRQADRLNVPVLLFHGDADASVPVETSDALAKARPDIVTYFRVSGATHVRSWNTDPERYEGAVTEFLRHLMKN